MNWLDFVMCLEERNDFIVELVLFMKNELISGDCGRNEAMFCYKKLLVLYYSLYN